MVKFVSICLASAIKSFKKTVFSSFLEQSVIWTKMARPACVASLGVHFLNKHSTPAFLCKLSLIPSPSFSVRRCSSSQTVYKIDHSGFVNPLESNPPRNDQLGIREVATNRNPRALEHLNVARRREGWNFQAPKRSFKNKLVLGMDGRYVVAHVEHSSGDKVRGSEGCFVYTKPMVKSHAWR